MKYLLKNSKIRKIIPQSMTPPFPEKQTTLPFRARENSCVNFTSMSNSICGLGENFSLIVGDCVCARFSLTHNVFVYECEGDAICVRSKLKGKLAVTRNLDVNRENRLIWWWGCKGVAMRCLVFHSCILSRVVGLCGPPMQQFWIAAGNKLSTEATCDEGRTSVEREGITGWERTRQMQARIGENELSCTVIRN